MKLVWGGSVLLASASLAIFVSAQNGRPTAGSNIPLDQRTINLDNDPPRVKRYTASYIRTSESGIANVLLGGANARKMAATLMPPSQRGRATSMKLGPKMGNLGSKARWGELAPDATLPSVDVDFGKAYQGNSLETGVSRVFEGVGTADGTLTLDLNNVGPFLIKKLYTTNGLLDDNGKPVVKDTAVKVTGNRLKVNIFEGQSYFVEMQMPIQSAGNFTGKVGVENGAKSRIDLKGRVLPPVGTLTASCLNSEITLHRGDSEPLDLLITPTGQGTANVQVKYLNLPAGLTIEGTSFSRKIKADDKIKNGDYPITIEVSAYGGQAKVLVDVLVRVETYWISLEKATYEGKSYFVANSDGDYATAFVVKKGEKIPAEHYVCVFGYQLTSSNGPGLPSSSMSNIRGKNMKAADGRSYAVMGNDPSVISNLNFNRCDVVFGKQPVTEIKVTSLTNPLKPKSYAVNELK